MSNVSPKNSKMGYYGTSSQLHLHLNKQHGRNEQRSCACSFRYKWYFGKHNENVNSYYHDQNALRTGEIVAQKKDDDHVYSYPTQVTYDHSSLYAKR